MMVPLSQRGLLFACKLPVVEARICEGALALLLAHLRVHVPERLAAGPAFDPFERLLICRVALALPVCLG
jgi:hypothetical protein